MAILDDLLNIPGTAAAGESTADGRLVDYKAKMDMSPELAATASKFTATMTMIFDALAAAYSELGQMAWVPQGGWMYSGGDWTVVVSGSQWSVIKTAEASFSKVGDPKTQAISVATLDDILKLKGAFAAGEYAPDGKSLACKSKIDLSPEMAATAAQFAASITLMCSTLAGAYAGLSKMAWVPIRGWLYSGGEGTCATSGTRWTFMRTAEVDFDELYSALIGR